MMCGTKMTNKQLEKEILNAIEDGAYTVLLIIRAIKLSHRNIEEGRIGQYIWRLFDRGTLGLSMDRKIFIVPPKSQK